MDDPQSEQGVPDPQARMRESWHEVAERFSALGRSAKERYRATATEGGDAADVATEAATDAATDAEGVGTDADDDEREARTSAALKAALEQLMSAGRELGERVADVARDDDLRSQAKQTSATLDEALSATVQLIEEQANSLFRRSKDRTEPADWDPPSGPPA